jgi:hypothetical protein
MKKSYIILLLLSLAVLASAYTFAAASTDGPINIHVSAVATPEDPATSIADVKLVSDVPGCGYVWQGSTDTDVTVNQESDSTNQFCQTPQFTGQFTIYISQRFQGKGIPVCSVTYDSTNPAIVSEIVSQGDSSYRCDNRGLQVITGHGDAPIPLITVYKVKHSLPQG